MYCVDITTYYDNHIVYLNTLEKAYNHARELLYESKIKEIKSTEYFTIGEVYRMVDDNHPLYNVIVKFIDYGRLTESGKDFLDMD